MRYSEIREARRNPEQNKKVSLLDALEKYRGRDDIFVSFTEDVGKDSHQLSRGWQNYTRDQTKARNASGHKVGINPKSKYNTPLGVYTYPVDYVIKNGGDVEFAGNAPFVQVLRMADDARVWYLTPAFREQWYEYSNVAKATVPDDEQEPSEDDFYDEDGEFDEDAFLYAMDEYKAKYEDDMGEIPSKIGRRFASLLRKKYNVIVDYDFANDEGFGIIHENEPAQAIFLTPDSYTHIDTIRNIRPIGNSKVDVYSENPKYFIKQLALNNVSLEVFYEVIGLLNKFDVLMAYPHFPEEVKERINNDLLSCRELFGRHFNTILAIADKIKTSDIADLINCGEGVAVDLISRRDATPQMVALALEKYPKVHLPISYELFIETLLQYPESIPPMKYADVREQDMPKFYENPKAAKAMAECLAQLAKRMGFGILKPFHRELIQRMGITLDN